ncbi:M1 family peptidase [Actinomadura craniellae]|uniref:Aminopeptidase N n=1 Tax=Actinomadura craniellae TaxID=2231787 RepID=A0A365H5Y9_9ACTN|nr:M1 family peptidase [Actinomadura craniellae]
MQRATTAVAAAATLLALDPAAAGALRVQAPGGPGAGDPYFPSAGNGGYDVLHYDVALTFRPVDGHIDATATIKARADRKLPAFNLDYRGPKIASVTVDGARARHRRSGQELTVTPASAPRRGKEFTTVVRYSGVPRSLHDGELGTYGWIRTADGALTLSEPDGTPTWLPVNDHPSDKATYEFRVTAPDRLQVVANGEPGPVTRQNGSATYVWRERLPMASYLAMVAIGRFQTRHGKAGPIPVITAVDPRFAKSAAPLHQTTVKVLNWQRKIFGPYPFMTAGGVIDDPRLDYALETQERPVYAGLVPDADFIVHELAHQWFGNSVTPRTWPDIWLNEGFATYAEWLWRERTRKNAAKRLFRSYHRQPARSAIFAPPPGRPGRKHMFGFSVYIRGAMTLHALRERVGDRAFFAILRGWAAEHRHGNADTRQFIALAERVSGKDLDRLFQVWLYTKGKPRSW